MSDTPDYVNGEPVPQHNFNPSVHDLLVNDAKHSIMGFGSSRVNDFIKQQMVDLFRTRKAYGYNKYGTILQAENGRDFLKDSLEETVDQLAYIRQGLEENPGNEVLKEAYRLAVAVLRELLVFKTRRDVEKEVASASVRPDPLLGRVE
jgi:hypothetical protein